MAEETTTRKKPTFLRNDWHKKIKLGRGVKRNQKWRGAKGIHSKVRLNRRGHPGRPRIGWGSEKETRNQVTGMNIVRIENLASLELVPKGSGILIGKVGRKKRTEILTKAAQLKLEVINKYAEKNDAAR